MKLANKVTPKVFPLISTTGRVALLTGITAGTVTLAEVEHAVLRDLEARPYRKPVVARGQRYPSITAAAEALAGRFATHREIKAWQVTIANKCNADNVVGYYWAA